MADPAARAARDAGAATPEARARKSAAHRAALLARLADPVARAAWSARAAEKGRENIAATRSPKACERRNKAIQEAAHSWCPPEYRALNDELRASGSAYTPLTDRKRIIADQIAADQRRAITAEAARLAAMTPHERNLERVRNGAQLVERVDLRRPDPTYTIGGVSGGML